MREVKMAWAYPMGSLNKIHISNNNVIRHNNKNEDRTYKYICLCHQKPVLAVKGKKQQHFRHDTPVEEDENLYFNALTKDNEGSVHKLGKKVYAELGFIKLPNPTVKEEEEFFNTFQFRNDLTGQIFTIEKPEIIKSFDFILKPELSKIEKELTHIKVIPDVLVEMENSDFFSKSRSVAIEVFVSHEVDEIKRNKYTNNDFSCIQVDLSKFLSTIDQNKDVDLEPLIKDYIADRLDIYDYIYFDFFHRLELLKQIFGNLYNAEFEKNQEKIVFEKSSYLQYSLVEEFPTILTLKNHQLNHCCPLCSFKLNINKKSNSFIHPKNDCIIFKLNKSEFSVELLKTLFPFFHHVLQGSNWNTINIDSDSSHTVFLEITAKKEGHNNPVTVIIYEDKIFKNLDNFSKLYDEITNPLQEALDTLVENKNRELLKNEKIMLFALNSNSIVSVNDNNRFFYKCICCNNDVKLHSKGKFFTHIYKDMSCSIFYNQKDYIFKLLEYFKLNNIKVNLTHQNYFLVLDDVVFINDVCYFDFKFSHINSIDDSIENHIIKYQQPLNILFEQLITDYSLFSQLFLKHFEKHIKFSLLYNEKKHNLDESKIVSRFIEIHDFFKIPLEEREYCLICDKKIEENLHKQNKKLYCPIHSLSDDRFNQYKNFLNNINSIFNKLKKVEGFNCLFYSPSWNNYVLDIDKNINVKKFKFNIINLKLVNGYINFDIFIMNKKFSCCLGLGDKNKTSKSIYFKFDSFTVKDIKTPLYITEDFLLFLKSL